MKKRISVLIPTYNEEENVVPLSEAIVAEFQKSLPQYEYEIVFIDNDSTDTTRDKIRMIRRSRLSLMQRILDNLIHHIMV